MLNFNLELYMLLYCLTLCLVNFFQMIFDWFDFTVLKLGAAAPSAIPINSLTHVWGGARVRRSGHTPMHHVLNIRAAIHTCAAQDTSLSLMPHATNTVFDCRREHVRMTILFCYSSCLFLESANVVNDLPSSMHDTRNDEHPLLP